MIRAAHPSEAELPFDGSERRAEPSVATRLATLVEMHLDFVWRSLRRLGVPESGVDDAAQQVWLVVARRLGDIAPDRERAFLFGAALRVASDARRALAKRREVLGMEPLRLVDSVPLADEIIDQKQARALLDEIMEALPMSLRAVFVLYELEELTVTEIASLLSIRRGTAASRLRRARNEFEKVVKRLRARGQIEGVR